MSRPPLRLLALPLAALCLAACRTPGGPASLHVAPRTAVPATAAQQAPAVAPATAGAGAPGASAAVPPAAVPPAPAPSGSSGGHEPGAPAPTTFLVGPDGQRVALVPGDEVPLPAGLTGLVTLFAPGRVPATIRLPDGGVPALHPQATAAEAPPAGLAIVEGAVSPAQSGVTVMYFSRDRRAFVGATTGADGRYTLSVPLDGTESGVVVARDTATDPHLGFARVTASAGATATAPPLGRPAPGAPGAAAPTPPGGMALTQVALLAVEDAAASPWTVPLLMADQAAMTAPAAYALAGAALTAAYAAEAADGFSGSEAAAPLDQAATFLAPPDLTALDATLSAGQALSWPAVPGATLYTARLTAVGQTAPVWEGASHEPGLTLPADLSLGAATLRLQVDAWNAPDVTIYSVAGLRALRVPSSLGGPSGRHSWALRSFGNAGKPGDTPL